MKAKSTAKRRVSQAIILCLSFVFAAPILVIPIQAFALDALTPAARISTSSTSTEANDESAYPSISADGRYVAFESDATNLVAGDTNGRKDIFVKDTASGVITRISISSSGVEGNSNSQAPSISASGRYVVFSSSATNLATGDTNGAGDVFLRDMQLNVTSIVSTSSSGILPNNVSYAPSISADGRYVIFSSYATNLVAGDTNGASDVFLKDLQTAQTIRVSTGAGNTEANGNSETGRSGGVSMRTVSDNGRYVNFYSSATNLVAGDTNGAADLFVKDLQTGAIVRANTDDSGVQGDGGLAWGPGAITADGRYVAFNSWDENLDGASGNQDIFFKDLQTGNVSRVNTSSNGDTANSYTDYDPSMSSDGRYVVFSSNADNLVPNDTNGTYDIFVKDTITGETARVSTGTSGLEADEYNDVHAISGDGRYIVFVSWATNIVPDDSNGSFDIFLRANPFATFLHDQDFSSTPLEAGTASDSVLSGATKNNQPLAPSGYVLSVADDGGLTGISINSDGALIIPSSAVDGTYTITYQACEAASPTYCYTATAVLGVTTGDDGGLAETGVRAGLAVVIPAVAGIILAFKTVLARQHYAYGQRSRLFH